MSTTTTTTTTEEKLQELESKLRHYKKWLGICCALLAWYVGYAIYLIYIGGLI